jgi:hypothetical protein
VCFRHLEGDPGLTDLRLRAHQPLPHGGRRHEERPTDLRGIEAEHRLQHERRVDVRVDSRMGTDEEQLQALVWNGIGDVRLFGVVDDELEGQCAFRPHALVPRAIDETTPRGREEPCFGSLRNTVFRPSRQRRHQRLAERVFGGRHIAGAD